MRQGRVAQLQVEDHQMSKLTETVREGAQALLEKADHLQERIRERAHAIWERQGRPHGRHQDHWEEAEKEIATETAAAPGGTLTGSKPKRVKGEVVPAATPAKHSRAKKSAPLAEAATAAEAAETNTRVKR
jgi:Protein of unknown function (DUF2934)